MCTWKYLIALIIIVSLAQVTCFSQADTLYTNNQKIVCTIKEISEVAVKFTYPGEDIVNSVFKNTVQRIAFRNGRIQTFAESTSFKPVKGVDEYENITMTSVFTEVQGLYKIGDVSAKAKGTTTLSNQERVKERAYRKVKIEAAMMGGNIIYLTDQRSEGNKYGGQYQAGSTTETSLTGVVYSNQLPNYDDFMKVLDGSKVFSAVEEFSMWSSDTDVTRKQINKPFAIRNIQNQNGIIVIEGDLGGVTKYHKFNLAYFTTEYFSIYYQDKSTAYNIKIRL